jgi:hypothetical protein
MAEKQPTLEELARTEAEALKRREQARQDYADGQKKIALEVPERFLTLAKQVREGVHRFNTAAPIERPVTYSESAAVTTRDPNTRGDFSFEVKRAPNQVVVALRQMTGTRSEAFVIDGIGNVGMPPMVDRFRLRVDALYKEGGFKWRMSCEGRPLDITVDELGDRLVMVIVTAQIARLWNVAPWVGSRV